MRIINETRSTVLAEEARLAASFVSRLVGLLGTSALAKGEGLILDPSNSIHSFFMRFTFDAVFLDRNSKVVGLLPAFRPFKISPVFLSSCRTLELPLDTIKSSDTHLGDTIRIIS